MQVGRVASGFAQGQSREQKVSGAGDPGTCGDGSTGSAAAPKTYFDATFCGDGNIRRLLTCNSSLARSTAQAQVPEVHMTMVIVNSSEYGGSGGAVATFSTNASSAEIGLHEMGHTAFGFADEYEFLSRLRHRRERP